MFNYVSDVKGPSEFDPNDPIISAMIHSKARQLTNQSCYTREDQEDLVQELLRKLVK